MAFKDPEKAKAYHRKWYAENKEKKKLISQRHYRKNRDALLAKRQTQQDKFIRYIDSVKTARGGCLHCGEQDTIVLIFHHRDPSQRTCSVTSLPTASRDKVDKEIAKCDVLCANCHMKEHYRMRNS
jgi:hypothetical protein